MKRKNVLFIFLSACLLGIMLSSAATAATWSKTTIDTSDNTGFYNSLALDSNNNPHISYHDGYNNVIKYKKKSGSAWTAETVGGTGSNGGTNTLKLDSKDNPSILYHYAADAFSTDQSYIYAKKVNGKWVTDKIFATGRGMGSSVALDGANNPHIIYAAFFSNTFYDLFYAKKVNGAWTTPERLYVNRPVSPSIAVDKYGNPHITYNDLDGYVMYGILASGKWTFTRVDSTSHYANPSIVVDSSGTPQISYYNANTGYVRYAKKVNNTWTSTNVENTGDCEFPLPCLTLNKAGTPQIIYRKYNGIIRYAIRNSSGWAIETVDTTQWNSGKNCLTVDKNGNLHASYHNWVLRYAYKDIAAPKVSSTIPTSNKTGYSRFANIYIKFNENIKASTSWNYIKIKNMSTNKYLTLTKTISKNILVLKTTARTRYTWFLVTLPKSAVKDSSGNNQAGNYLFRFKTGT